MRNFLTPTVPGREMVSRVVQRITTDERPSHRALKGCHSYPEGNCRSEPTHDNPKQERGAGAGEGRMRNLASVGRNVGEIFRIRE